MNRCAPPPAQHDPADASVNPDTPDMMPLRPLRRASRRRATDTLSRSFTAGLVGLACATPGVAQEPADTLPPAEPPTIGDFVEADLARGPITAIVAGVVSQGQVDFLNAWGTLSAETTDSTTVMTPMAFPALSEILLAMTVRAFASTGALDADAPLSRWLPEWTGRLGGVTLNQLLSHTAGLDQSPLLPDQTWEEAIAALDDDSFVAEPGAVYSVSRYSFPLAAYVLERLAGMPFTEIAGQAVLAPLGMARSTFDPDSARAAGLATGYERGPDGPIPVAPPTEENGLPVLYTTTPDVLQLLSAWMSGVIRGSSPVGTAPPDVPRLDVTRHFGDGVMQDVAALVPQAWSNRGGAGFGSALHLYPEQETALFIWGNGDIPRGTLTWVRTLVAEAVGDVETSLASQGVRVTRSLDPSLAPDGLDELNEWAGLYRNGGALIGLRLVDGVLNIFDGERDIPLQGIAPATFAAPGGLPLELLRVGDQRVVLFDDLAYAWESAEVPAAPPGGGGAER